MVGRNLRVLGISQLLAKGAGFGAVLVLARALAPADFGRYTAALALVTLLSVAVELGTSGYIVREGAQRPEDLGRLLGHVLVVRAVLGAASMGAVIPLASALGYDGPTRTLVILFTAGTAIRLTGNAMLSALQALERMDDVAALQARSALVQAAAVAIAAAAGWGLAGIGWAMLISSVANPIWGRSRLRKRWSGRIHLGAAGMPRTLRAALAFGLSAGLGTTLTYLDSVMVHVFRGPVDTALYGAAYRVVLALGIIPIVYADAVMRQLARLAAHDLAEMGRLYRRSVAHLIAVATPVVVGGIAVGAPLLGALFGPSYVAAAPALSVLLLSLLVAYPGALGIAAAYAVGRERQVAATLAVAVAGNGLANLWLIPTFGLVGAAWATVGAEILIIGVLSRILRRAGVPSRILPATVRPLIAAVAMLAVVLPLRSMLPVALGSGVVVYLAAFWLAGGFVAEDRQLVAGFLRAGWTR